jgi:hypothetical protein
MSTTIRNYDGSLVATPQRVVRPTSVSEIQDILRDTAQYPAPVRAKGSYHSLTPCVSTPGTVVDMEGLKQVVAIDADSMTFTGQAGLEMIEANKALRAKKLQFVLNIEIGNMTLGAAACCQSKDALDGVELGQVNSYVTAIKWVDPSGALREASEGSDPELLSKMRGSYGLAGIVYEVTFRIKPLQIVRFDYDIHDVDELTQQTVDDAIGANESLVCWTVGRNVVIQTRNTATELKHEWLGKSRRFGWNFLAAFTGRAIRDTGHGGFLSNLAEDLGMGVELGFYRLLSAGGGFTLYDADKMIDYSKTPESARYAFTFWAFPRGQWVQNLKDYLAFADAHADAHGFRCNMPLGSYFIRQDSKSILSYTHDGDVFSIDPIHAPGKDKPDWDRFLQAFNAWAFERGGIPLLNQSPFVTREHCVGAYGDRWRELTAWVKTEDPTGRLLNQFFADLLV